MTLHSKTEQVVCLGIKGDKVQRVTGIRGGSRGRVQGVSTPPLPPEMTCGSKAFFFVFAIKICLRPVTSQLRHSLVVHPLLKKNPGSAPEGWEWTTVHQNCHSDKTLAHASLF